MQQTGALVLTWLLATAMVAASQTTKPQVGGNVRSRQMSQNNVSEIDISAVIDGVRIPGKLTVPQNTTASLLLIPGSLNSDVDGNYAPMFPGQPAVAPHAYKDLADQLASMGIAVLRFSKTGPGTGSEVLDRERAAEKYKLFSQRIRVAEVFLGELRSRVPGRPLFVAGHSEGAVVASMLVQAHAEIRGIILLSGPAQPLLHMMVSQQFDSDKREGKLSPERQGQYAAALAALDDFVAARPLPQDVANNPYLAFVPFMVRPENVSYLRSLESVDPAAEFAKVRQAALIVQGGRDSSVSPKNADTLQRQKNNAKLAMFPGLQHFYKAVPEALSPQESFSQASESDPAVARAVASWIATLGQP